MINKKKIVVLSCTALGAVLLALMPTSGRGQAACPCSWYDAVPDPEWGLPGTLGDLLPVQYYDAETAGAYFLVPLAGLQSLLPPQLTAMDASASGSLWSGLVPPGFGVLCAFFGEYNSLLYWPAYHEAILGIMVHDPVTGSPSWHIISITVTTEQAQWGGIVAYGLPKVLGAVHIQAVKPKGIKCHDSVDDGLIMNLEIPTADMFAQNFDPIMCVSIKEGYFVHFSFALTGTTYLGYGTATIQLGQHPTARQLRAIGLEQCPSIGVFHGVHLQGTLSKGTCSPLP